MDYKILKLLEEANAIAINYENKEKESGQRFNLFSILDRETDEVKTHSSLIAELLNPQGSHGQGYDFLEFFVEVLEKNQRNSISCKAQIPRKTELKNLQVYVERNVGKFRGSKCRLDILLSNNKWQVCIENKFNAKQGELQLERYFDYLGEDNARQTLLIYLTKTNKESDEYKSEELKNGTDFFWITYEKDILEWLDKCIEKCEQIPILKESLTQYSNLLKQETNQTINREMKNEMQQAVLKYGLKGALEIKNVYEDTLTSVSEKLKESVKNKLKTKYSLQDNEILHFHENGIAALTKPFSSLFLKVKNTTFGIEPFYYGKSLFENSLFIGKVNLEPKSEAEKSKYANDVWYVDSREIIYSQERFFEILDEYGKNENQEQITNKIVEKIIEYIDRSEK